jgi:glycine oxidase
VQSAQVGGAWPLGAKADMAAQVRRSSDVIVLGGGVIGLQIARELRGRGREVVLLERGQPGRQASWASAGIVGDRSPSAQDPVSQLRHPCVDGYTRLAAQLREEVGLDIEYVENGMIEVAFDEPQAARLAEETSHERSLGLATELVRGRELHEAEPRLSERVVAARLTPGGQVEPRRLCRALELAIRQQGVRLVTGTPATALLSESGRVTGARTMDGDFHAPLVVNCMGSWSGRLQGCEPAVPVVPQRGQILALRPSEQPLRRVLLREDDPYVVPRPDGRLVVGATRELVGYDSSLTAEGVAWLLRSAIDMLPVVRDAPIQQMWTGFRPLSLDGLPVIGPGAVEGLFFATGHGQSGITWAPGTVQIISALLDGRPSPIAAEPFSPLRFQEGGAASALGEIQPRAWYV